MDLQGRVFDYRRKATWKGYLGIGALMIAVAPFGNRFHAPPFVEASFGFALVLWAALEYLRGRNERITVVGGRIVWNDRWGKERMEAAFEDVIRGSFRVKPVNVRSVQTSKGQLVWTSAIEQFEDLNQLMRRLAARE